MKNYIFLFLFSLNGLSLGVSGSKRPFSGELPEPKIAKTQLRKHLDKNQDVAALLLKDAKEVFRQSPGLKKNDHENYFKQSYMLLTKNPKLSKKALLKIAVTKTTDEIKLVAQYLRELIEAINQKGNSPTHLRASLKLLKLEKSFIESIPVSFLCEEISSILFFTNFHIMLANCLLDIEIYNDFDRNSATQKEKIPLAEKIVKQLDFLSTQYLDKRLQQQIGIDDLFLKQLPPKKNFITKKSTMKRNTAKVLNSATGSISTGIPSVNDQTDTLIEPHRDFIEIGSQQLLELPIESPDNNVNYIESLQAPDENSTDVPIITGSQSNLLSTGYLEQKDPVDVSIEAFMSDIEAIISLVKSDGKTDYRLSCYLGILGNFFDSKTFYDHCG
ncbi:MAG: hypothetical protein KC505_04870, partial [Myxococcales bacterium]|nr:hypothetical protein [Myxococcales bacterium]